MVTEPQIIERLATKSECWATNVYQKSLPPDQQNKNYRKFYECRPKLFLHSLGCARDSADLQCQKWDNPNGQAIAHACVDARDGKTRQALPWDYRGWHAGTDGNNCAIGVEMAESLSIKYVGGDKFEVLDLAKAQADCKRAYDGAVELFAWLCQRFGIDPMTEILSHNEWNRQRGEAGHTDPEHYWRGLSMPYTMDGFRAAVKAKLDEAGDVIYRIQVGAFRNRAYAEAYLARVQETFPNAYITTKGGG